MSKWQCALREAHLDGMSKLLAVLALHLRPVLRLRAIPREVTGLLAVTAGNVVGVLGLITLLGHVILGTAVAAGALLDVGTLLRVSIAVASCRDV